MCTVGYWIIDYQEQESEDFFDMINRLQSKRLDDQRWGIVLFVQFWISRSKSTLLKSPTQKVEKCYLYFFRTTLFEINREILHSSRNIECVKHQCEFFEKYIITNLIFQMRSGRVFGCDESAYTPDGSNDALAQWLVTILKLLPILHKNDPKIQYIEIVETNECRGACPFCCCYPVLSSFPFARPQFRPFFPRFPVVVCRVVCVRCMVAHFC